MKFKDTNRLKYHCNEYHSHNQLDTPSTTKVFFIYNPQFYYLI